MPKNIVILADGTGQIGGEGASTNVYKLFNMLEDRTPRQVVYYDPGIGTSKWKYFHQIFGVGFKQNILDCYRFIFDQYESGDQIYMFGFSRGAATVRSLSGFLELFGILPQSRPDLIEKAWKIYQIECPKSDEKHTGIAHDKREKRNDREKIAEAFVNKHHTMWTRVRFLGVWDTVAALGAPGALLDMFIDRFWPHNFHNFNLSPGVDFARHALSIDDDRKTFHPKIWRPIPEGENSDRLKQVWFCGVHTDVGGGYDQPDLSYYSLDWMIREAKDKGLLIYEDSREWKRFRNLQYNIEGKMHNERTGLKKYLYRREVRSWPDNFGPICLHESVLMRKRNNVNTENPNYDPWVLKVSNRTLEK